MPVIYDHAITDARRAADAHHPSHPDALTTCVTCGVAWPCKPFAAAFALITRNSNTRATR
jgi:hypothetical protein